MDETQYVQPGNWVVLHSTDGRKVLGNATKSAVARIGKRKRKIGSVIGHRWGQNFMVCDDDKLEAVSDKPAKQLSDQGSMVSEKDNRFLQDTNANQTLEQEAIKELQEKGVKGEQLVQTVVKHSATFKDKTAFSQDKYLKRKRAKFDLHARLIRPTAAALCDVYLVKSPEKTMHIRSDSLGLLLAYSGVRAGARVLVYENCIGLVAAAVAERLGGHGVAMNLFSSHTPPGVELLRMLNLPAEHIRSIVHTPIQLLETIDVDEPIDNEPIKYSVTNNMQNDTDKNKSELQNTTNGLNSTCKEQRQALQPDTHEPNPTRAEAIAQRPKRGVLKEWLKAGCDCLVVATRYDVVKVFDILLKHVAPSGCFAAYCIHLQDAADLQYALQLSRMATRIELWEPTLVHHQVLPGRTHPEMTDSATGGYIVSGIRVETSQLETGDNNIGSS